MYFRHLLLVVALCTAGCGGDSTPARPQANGLPAAQSPSLPAGLTPVAAAQLDSGNVAFRLKQYAQALTYYEHASTSVPNHPAPWYGMYMVAQAMGNSRLADSALAQVGTRSGGSELLNQSVSQSHGQAGEAGGTASTSAQLRASGADAERSPNGGAVPARHPVLARPR